MIRPTDQDIARAALECTYVAEHSDSKSDRSEACFIAQALAWTIGADAGGAFSRFIEQITVENRWVRGEINDEERELLLAAIPKE